MKIKKTKIGIDIHVRTRGNLVNVFWSECKEAFTYKLEFFTCHSFVKKYVSEDGIVNIDNINMYGFVKERKCFAIEDFVKVTDVEVDSDQYYYSTGLFAHGAFAVRVIAISRDQKIHSQSREVFFYISHDEILKVDNVTSSRRVRTI
ncbi:hypothetical protein RI065_06425 [Mycoplasmatota bacterium zrk1]